MWPSNPPSAERFPSPREVKLPLSDSDEENAGLASRRIRSATISGYSLRKIREFSENRRDFNSLFNFHFSLFVSFLLPFSVPCCSKSKLAGSAPREAVDELDDEEEN